MDRHGKRAGDTPLVLDTVTNENGEEEVVERVYESMLEAWLGCIEVN